MFWMKKYKKVTQAEWDKMAGLVTKNAENFHLMVGTLEHIVTQLEQIRDEPPEDVQPPDSVTSMTEQDDEPTVTTDEMMGLPRLHRCKTCGANANANKSTIVYCTEHEPCINAGNEGHLDRWRPIPEA